MNRWYAITEPQHMLPADGTCAFGNSVRHASKPAPREAPTSA